MKTPLLFATMIVMLLTHGFVVAQDTTLTITPAGSVGIGTTAPAYKLDVNGEVNASGVRVNGVPVATGSGSQWTTSGSNIYYNSGNVGIGLSNPEFPLHVGPLKFVRFELGLGKWLSLGGLGTFEVDAPGVRRGRFVIEDNGNVGIGVPAPGAKLEIGKVGAGTTAILGRGQDPSFAIVAFQGTGNNPNDDLGGIGVSYNTGPVERGLFFNRGSSPTDGSVVLAQNGFFNGAPFIEILPSVISLIGNVCYTGSLGACSDVRFKKDIVPLTNAIDNLGKLEGVSYYWKAEEFPDKNFSDRKQIGVLAQEVEKIYPELVTTDNDGYKSVDYTKLTPILVEAVKELNAKIIELKSAQEENKLLSSRLARLEAAVQSLTMEKSSVGDKSLGELR